MSTMILPGTYIDVLAEGLIAPGQVTVGNLGVVGTASKGDLNTPKLLSSYNDALSIFGPYDSFEFPDTDKWPLTLVRALQLAFSSGATTVYAVRIADESAGTGATTAAAVLKSASGDCVKLSAKSPGTWASGLNAIVSASDPTDNYIQTDAITLTAGEATAKKITLTQKSADSPRNRVSIRHLDGTASTPALVASAPAAGQAEFAGNTLLFGDTLDAGAVVTATYKVDPGNVRKVKVTLGNATETYLVISGDTLIAAIMDNQNGSALVTATAAANSKELPGAQKVTFTAGTNGAKTTSQNYKNGLDALLDVDAHIIVAAGQTDKGSGADLDAHCQKASTDDFKRDRIAVVGCGSADPNNIPGFVDGLVGNTLASDRVILIAPGMQTGSDAAADAPVSPITVPGAYTAAVIAGMLAGLDPQVSLTNKPVLGVAALEVVFNNAQLTELVQNRVTALEVNQGIRVLRGQTTDSGAFREITTRRIVDYAKYGVRAAAQPYIGLLNNDRVRGALRATLNSFLQGMLDSEMLVDYTIDVTATRDQQIQGIVQVTIGLQPVFSINFIHVTMILS